jgi:hypothetical protein
MLLFLTNQLVPIYGTTCFFISNQSAGIWYRYQMLIILTNKLVYHRIWYHMFRFLTNQLVYGVPHAVISDQSAWILYRYELPGAAYLYTLPSENCFRTCRLITVPNKHRFLISFRDEEIMTADHS